MDLSKEAISRLIISENPTILEIGLYDGADSRELLKLIPEATIHGFECDPRSIALYKTLGVDKRIILHETALSSKVGLSTLYLSDSETRRHYTDQDNWSASSSLRQPKEHLNLFPDVDFNSTISVPCTTLDKWNEEHKLSYIDFVWADVNGSEYDLIFGGEKTFNNCVKYLYIEFCVKELYVGQKTKEEMLKLLPNFKEIGIYNFLGNFGNVLLENITI